MALLALPLQTYAQDSYKTVATISATLGNEAGRVCVGAPISGSIRGALGCPSSAPQIVGGGISASGIITATHFEGDGSRLTGISAGAGDTDRIVSGTLAVVTNSNTSIVSLSTAGTTWGYLGNLASYLPRLTAIQVSASSISGTLIQVGNSGVGCSGALAGGMRFNSTSGKMEYCDSATWKALLNEGVSGTLVAYGSVASDGSCLSCVGATVARPATGNYDVTLANAQPNSNYTVQLTASSVSTGVRSVVYSAVTTTGFNVKIRNSGNDLANEPWSFAVISQQDPGGSGGGAALGDRITSGTLAMIANSATSVVSLSTAGTTWGYFGSLLSYLPQLNSSRVSATNVTATNVSASIVQFHQNSFTCTPALYGSMHYDSNGDLSLCSPD